MQISPRSVYGTNLVMLWELNLGLYYTYMQKHLMEYIQSSDRIQPKCHYAFGPLSKKPEPYANTYISTNGHQCDRYYVDQDSYTVLIALKK